MYFHCSFSLSRIFQGHSLSRFAEGRLWTELAGVGLLWVVWPHRTCRSPLRHTQVISVAVGPAAAAVMVSIGFLGLILSPCSAQLRQLKTYLSADNSKMWQLQDLSSGGCNAVHDQVKTDLISAVNATFSTFATMKHCTCIMKYCIAMCLLFYISPLG